MLRSEVTLGTQSLPRAAANESLQEGPHTFVEKHLDPIHRRLAVFQDQKHHIEVSEHLGIVVPTLASLLRSCRQHRGLECLRHPPLHQTRGFLIPSNEACQLDEHGFELDTQQITRPTFSLLHLTSVDHPRTGKGDVK